MMVNGKSLISNYFVGANVDRIEGYLGKYEKLTPHLMMSIANELLVYISMTYNDPSEVSQYMVDICNGSKLREIVSHGCSRSILYESTPIKAISELRMAQLIGIYTGRFNFISVLFKKLTERGVMNPNEKIITETILKNMLSKICKHARRDIMSLITEKDTEVFTSNLRFKIVDRYLGKLLLIDNLSEIKSAYVKNMGIYCIEKMSK